MYLTMEEGPHLSMQVPRAPHTLGIRPEAMRPMTDPIGAEAPIHALHRPRLGPMFPSLSEEALSTLVAKG